MRRLRKIGKEGEMAKKRTAILEKKRLVERAKIRYDRDDSAVFSDQDGRNGDEKRRLAPNFRKNE